MMPFEYILMFFLALAPPLYRMMMDPRVEAIEDAKKGIKNPDAWNWEMPLSEADKARHKICYVYFAAWFIFITYLTIIV